MKREVGSIYGRAKHPRQYGDVQPIGCGRGGDGDPEYRPIDPSNKLLSGTIFPDVLEVPPVLTLGQFLEIQNACSD